MKTIVKIYIFILLATLVNSNAGKRPTCHACFNHICYRRDVILKGSRCTGQLAIDRTSNTVYFHYKNKHSIDVTGAFDFDDAKFHDIPNIGFTFGHTVDQTNRDLYASGVKGVYKYNPVCNTTELFALKEKTIWHMQFTDKLFYTVFKTKGLFSFVNRKSIEIPGLSEYHIDDFIIDKNNDTYFMSNYAIYLLKNGAKSAKLYENEIYSLATDKNGEAYFVQPYTRGVYKTSYKTGKLSEVGAFSKGSAYKLVFDSDNHIIYYNAKDKNLYYLSPTMNKCSVTMKGSGKNSKKFVANVNMHRRLIKYLSNNTIPLNKKDKEVIKLKFE